MTNTLRKKAGKQSYFAIVSKTKIPQSKLNQLETLQ